MDFKSHSQAGQDRFIHAVLGGMRDGLFVDCGCNHPVEKSNTFSLERDWGWRGLLVDNDEHCVRLCEEQRSKQSKVFKANALTADWAFGFGTALHLFAEGCGDAYKARDNIDYLSLDCDPVTEPVLELMLDSTGKRFRAITVEHDAYRFGEAARDRMVALLRGDDYDVLCSDVCDQGMSFEIWAVDPKLVDMKLAERFRRDKPTDWKEFFR